MTTQYATASYQEIIDLHTETDRVSVIGIHTPVTETPYSMMQPFFDAFQRYHYDGCSLVMVPAARLPADPSQISYGAGEPPIDPRDLLNPILWHGCHGESLGSVLNQFYADGAVSSDFDRRMFDSGEYTEKLTSQIGDVGTFESLYYRALVDKTWLKAHPQKGFRKSGLHPMVYEVSTDRQYLSNPTGSLAPKGPLADTLAGDPSDNNGLGSNTNRGTLGYGYGSNASAMYALGNLGLQRTVQSGSGQDAVFSANLPYVRDGSFFTSRLHGLGWLDTRQRVFGATTGVSSSELIGNPDEDASSIESMYSAAEQYGRINYLPRLFMGLILLPPAYKTEQYFRIILNHRFSFKKYRGVSMRGEFIGSMGPGSVPSYQNLN